MATNLGSGSQGDHCWHVNNLHHCYRMDGGTVYVRRFDLEGNEIGSEQTTNLTGLDDAPIQIEPSVDGDGNARIVALVMSSGDVHTYVSTDSINFY
jgi:hypothetical protein